eukprot:6838985-Alexandrium_andersonii.AAC.1
MGPFGRKAVICTERFRSPPKGIVLRRKAPLGGGSSGPFCAKRCLAAQNEAFRCKKRPFGRKAPFCIDKCKTSSVGQCR